jgi:hypothetical protein
VAIREPTEADLPLVSRSTSLAALPLLAGIFLAFLGLQWARSHLTFNMETAGLGVYTTSVFGELNGPRIHCADNRDTALCQAAYEAAARPPAVLWLGNSQLHAVNGYKEGDSTAPMLLHRWLAPKGLYVVSYSEPNANLLEHRLMFNRMKHVYRVRTLVLSVSFDKFRETGIRSTLQPSSDTKPQAAEPPIRETNLQSAVEPRLQQFLANHWGFWRDRDQLKGLAEYAVLVGHLRIVGITAQTRRPVSSSLYAEKMDALRGLIAEARSNSSDVILYAQPFRSDVRGPYDPAQYAQFLRDLRSLAAPGVRNVDLTNLVPGSEWGLVKDPLFGFIDYDFMHFTGEGHYLLASALLRMF